MLRPQRAAQQCDDQNVAIWTLRDIETAVRSAWSLETCDPVDVDDWSVTNPARGQCGVTALVLHDLLGGELLTAEVLLPDGSRQGYHHWNRLAGGIEVELTAEQFDVTEVVQPPSVIERHGQSAGRFAEQYDVMRERVFAALAAPR